MFIFKSFTPLKRISLFIFSIFIIGCIDPAKPEYNFIDDLVYIDAIASTVIGASYVTISKSEMTSISSRNVFVEGANVTFVNSITKEEITLNQEEGIYVPPANFVVNVSETWELMITMPNGEIYKSTAEKVLNSVPITDLKANYKPELSYNDEVERYVPGHVISVDFNDPPNEDNYYYWNFRSYEKLKYCKLCENGIFRNGICIPNTEGVNGKSYYDYYCSSDCWSIRYSESVKIYDDKFSNGLAVNDLNIADVFLYSSSNALVEIQQITLPKAAYDYYEVLKDIIDNNGNFNAPPPAAFIGNIFNPDDSDEYILGRFTAASTATYSIFINRENITEEVIDKVHRIQYEVCEEVCSSRCKNPTGEGYCNCCICGACRRVILSPCEENHFRTGTEPIGWIE